MNSLKAETFLQLVAKEEIRDLDACGHMENSEWSLAAKSNTQLIASKKTRTLIHNHKN